MHRVSSPHSPSNRFHLFFFSSRRRHTRLQGDWSSDVCSSDLDDSPVNTGRVTGTTNFVENNPLPIPRQLLERGQQRFQINCSPCHGATADGNGDRKSVV